MPSPTTRKQFLCSALVLVQADALPSLDPAGGDPTKAVWQPDKLSHERVVSCTQSCVGKWRDWETAERRRLQALYTDPVDRRAATSPQASDADIVNHNLILDPFAASPTASKEASRPTSSRPAETVRAALFGGNMEITRHNVWGGVSAQLVANRVFGSHDGKTVPRWTLMGNARLSAPGKSASAAAGSYAVECPISHVSSTQSLPSPDSRPDSVPISCGVFQGSVRGGWTSAAGQTGSGLPLLAGRHYEGRVVVQSSGGAPVRIAVRIGAEAPQVVEVPPKPSTPLADAMLPTIRAQPPTRASTRASTRDSTRASTAAEEHTVIFGRSWSHVGADGVRGRSKAPGSAHNAAGSDHHHATSTNGRATKAKEAGGSLDGLDESGDAAASASYGGGVAPSSALARGWTTYPFAFTASRSCNATITISVAPMGRQAKTLTAQRPTPTATTLVRLGAVSLMPSDHERGLRRDVLDALRTVGFQGPFRWPGGCFSSIQPDWRHGLSPADERPPFRAPPDGWFCVASEGGVLASTDGFAINHPSIDEYLYLMERIGGEPAISLQLQFGSTEEVERARQLIEYVNGDPITTRLGRLRARRGRPTPWRVRKIFLGNEAGCQPRFNETRPDAEVREERFAYLEPPTSLEYAAMLREVIPVLKAAGGAGSVPLELIATTGSPNITWPRAWYPRAKPAWQHRFGRVPQLLQHWNAPITQAVGAELYAASYHYYTKAPLVAWDPKRLTEAARLPAELRDAIVTQRRILDQTRPSAPSNDPTRTTRVGISLDEWGFGPPYEPPARFERAILPRKNAECRVCILSSSPTKFELSLEQVGCDTVWGGARSLRRRSPRDARARGW